MFTISRGADIINSSAEIRDHRALPLLFILLEEPQNGFAKAISQFKETAGLSGVSKAEHVMTVNGDGEPIDPPREIAPLLK